MKKLSKIFAVVLVLALALSMLPMGAGAIAATAGATATLVTDASALVAGDQIVIVAKDADCAMSTNQKSNNRGIASVTKNGNEVTLTADVEVLTLAAGTATGSFAFAVADGSYLYAPSSTANYLRTTSTLNEAASFNITIDSGVASIVCVDTSLRGCLFYNQTSTLFSCYASTTTIADKDVQIYKLAAAVQDTREDLPASASAIVDAIYALQAGESLSKYYKFESFTMTGTIVTATEVWNETYSNGTVTIKVDGTDKELVVFRYKKADAVDVEDVKALVVGDKVTFEVESAQNYDGEFELVQPTLTTIEKAQTPSSSAPATSTPAGTTGTQNPDNTGDNTGIVSMTAVMVVAVVALAVLVIGNKKKMF